MKWPMGTCPLFLVDFVKDRHDTCSPSIVAVGWLDSPFDIFLIEIRWLTSTSSTDHISWNENYTNFRKYAYTWIRKLIKKLKTLDISTTLFDNVAFVFFHVMETFSKDFLEVYGLKSRGFPLLLHKLQQHCGQNFEKKCNYICRIKQEIVEGWECSQSVA